jgi:hypothetical protein
MRGIAENSENSEKSQNIFPRSCNWACTLKNPCCGGWKISWGRLFLEGTQAWNFFLNLFAETETLWSQGPVTQDFWISYSIWPRYSSFKHFRVCSASDEIHSAYAQPAIKFVPVCSVCDKIHSAYTQHGFTCKTCSHFTVGWAYAKIRSSYAKCAIKSFPRMFSMYLL